jgi:hypothetical protein
MVEVETPPESPFGLLSLPAAGLSVLDGLLEVGVSETTIMLVIVWPTWLVVTRADVNVVLLCCEVSSGVVLLLLDVVVVEVGASAAVVVEDVVGVVCTACVCVGELVGVGVGVGEVDDGAVVLCAGAAVVPA